MPFCASLRNESQSIRYNTMPRPCHALFAGGDKTIEAACIMASSSVCFSMICIDLHTDQDKTQAPAPPHQVSIYQNRDNMQAETRR